MSTIQLKRGSTLELPLQVQRGGVAFSLVGKTITYLVKAKVSDADADAILTFTDSDGISVTGASTGHFSLLATAAEMDLPKRFYYAFCQIRDTSTGAIIELPEDESCDVWEIIGHGVFSTV